MISRVGKPYQVVEISTINPRGIFLKVYDKQGLKWLTTKGDQQPHGWDQHMLHNVHWWLAFPSILHLDWLVNRTSHKGLWQSARVLNTARIFWGGWKNQWTLNICICHVYKVWLEVLYTYVYILIFDQLSLVVREFHPFGHLSCGCLRHAHHPSGVELRPRRAN